MGSCWNGVYTMNNNIYEVKIVSGSSTSVDALVKNELREYPQNDYGTVVLELEKTSHVKTVRIVRYKTKELCKGRKLVFKEGVYPFDSDVSL